MQAGVEGEWATGLCGQPVADPATPASKREALRETARGDETALTKADPELTVNRVSDRSIQVSSSENGAFEIRTAKGQNYDLSIRGASNDMRYAISGSYFNQEGVVINSEFERYNLSTRHCGHRFEISG